MAKERAQNVNTKISLISQSISNSSSREDIRRQDVHSPTSYHIREPLITRSVLTYSGRYVAQFFQDIFCPLNVFPLYRS